MSRLPSIAGSLVAALAALSTGCGGGGSSERLVLTGSSTVAPLMAEIGLRFEAAHHLPGYPGKCARPHGHGYRLEVTVSGPVREDGLVMDFYDLKRIVEERVISQLDHRDLNGLEAFAEVNPTAENIARYVYEQLGAELPGGVEVHAVTVFETERCSATYTESGPEAAPVGQ